MLSSRALLLSAAVSVLNEERHQVTKHAHIVPFLSPSLAPPPPPLLPYQSFHVTAFTHLRSQRHFCVRRIVVRSNLVDLTVAVKAHHPDEFVYVVLA